MSLSTMRKICAAECGSGRVRHPSRLRTVSPTLRPTHAVPWAHTDLCDAALNDAVAVDVVAHVQVLLRVREEHLFRRTAQAADTSTLLPSPQARAPPPSAWQSQHTLLTHLEGRVGDGAACKELDLHALDEVRDGPALRPAAQSPAPTGTARAAPHRLWHGCGRRPPLVSSPRRGHQVHALVPAAVCAIGSQVCSGTPSSQDADGAALSWRLLATSAAPPPPPPSPSSHRAPWASCLLFPCMIRHAEHDGLSNQAARRSEARRPPPHTHTHRSAQGG